MSEYLTNESGIRLDGGPEVSWEDLADALASALNPMSSGAAIRADLVQALQEGEVSGTGVGILRTMIAATDPRTALETALVHPSETDPVGWAISANHVLQD